MSLGSTPPSFIAIVIARAGLCPVGSGSVMCVVRGEAVAKHLGVDLGSAFLRAPSLLEHEDGPGLAHDESVAPRVERTARPRGRVVAPRERPHRAEAGDSDLGHPRLRPAAEHHVGAPSRIASRPSPIAMFDAAQAAHWEVSGPFVPSPSSTHAAPMFGMIAGRERVHLVGATLE